MRNHMLRSFWIKRNVAHLENVISTTGGSTYTFNNVSFGQASSDRYVVVVAAFQSPSSTTFTSMTIGGVSATAAVSRPATTQGMAIYFALITSGTSGTIVTTTGANCSAQLISVYSIRGIGTSLVGTGNSNGLTGTPASITTTLNTSRNGVAIAGVRRSGGSIPSVSSANSILQFSTTYGHSTQNYVSGFFSPTVQATPDTFTGTSPSASGTMTICVAHFI